MGEAAIKEKMLSEALTGGDQTQLNVTAPQAVVLSTITRTVQTLATDAKFLADFGEKDASAALLSAADHLDKYAKRYVHQLRSGLVIAPASILKP